MKNRIRFAALVLTLHVAAVLAPVARAQDTPDDREGAEAAVKYGIKRYRAGEYEEALLAGKEACAAVAGHAEGTTLLASALLATGAHEELEEAMRAQIEVRPESARAHLFLGESLRARGRLEEAQKALARAVELDAKLVPARTALAEVALEREDRETAEKTARTILVEVEGGAADARGVSLEELDAYARACLVADHVKALKDEYKRHMFHYARDIYQRAYDKDPEDADVLARWARLYMDKWNLPEARRLMKAALKLNPNHPEAQIGLAATLLLDFYGGTDRYAEARRAIERALDVNPRLVEGHVLLAELLITDALYDDALVAIARGLAVDPTDVRALSTRAAIFRIRGERAKYDEVAAAIGEKGTRAAEFHTRVAVLLDSRFRYGEAHEVARRAVLADETYWPAYSQLGLAAMRTGDEAEARRFLEKARAADPFDLFSENLLTLLDYLDKDFVTLETDHFIVRLEKEEAKLLAPILLELLERCHEELTERYRVEVPGKCLFELFPGWNDFSVRAVAHRFIPASGVTFARVIAAMSPRGLPPGTHNWGRTIWHEYAHVVTLEATQYRIPRWLTEGIAVYEESKGHASWVRESDKDLMDALARGRLLPIREIDQGFSKPRFPNQVMLSYYQGGLICEFIEHAWGFGGILKLLEGYRLQKPIDAIFRDGLDVTPEEFDRRFLDYARATFKRNTYRPPVGPEDLPALARAARSAPKDVEKQVAHAFAAVDNGKLADADTAVSRALLIDPQNADAMLVRARLEARRRRFDKAKELALEALTAGTKDPYGARMLLVSIYTGDDTGAGKAARDVKQAIVHLEAARELFPRNVGLYPMLAALYEETEQAEKRLAILEQYAALESKDVAVRLELAKAFAGRSEPEKVLKLVEEGIWIDPFQPGLHAAAIDAHLARADLKAARVAADRLKIIEPSVPPPMKPAILEAVKKVEEAEKKQKEKDEKEKEKKDREPKPAPPGKDF